MNGKDRIEEEISLNLKVYSSPQIKHTVYYKKKTLKMYWSIVEYHLLSFIKIKL